MSKPMTKDKDPASVEVTQDEDAVSYLTTWADDIERNSGPSVDARRLRSIASEICALRRPEAVAEAVAAERERCARIAGQTKAYDDPLQKSAGCATTGERIAAAIRASVSPDNREPSQHHGGAR